MKHLKPYDLVLADRGFTVRELLNPLQVELKILTVLKGRKCLSAAEELETRPIAKARIHVERFNERLKQFKLVGRKMPLRSHEVFISFAWAETSSLICEGERQSDTKSSGP